MYKTAKTFCFQKDRCFDKTEHIFYQGYILKEN